MGAAVARLFAKEGAKVAIMGRREAPLKETIQKIRSEGFEASYFCGDVSKESDVPNVITKVNELYGPVDALVNCAGVINSQPEEPVEMTGERWDWLMDINAKGIFHTTKHVVANMVKSSKKGTIVNIASTCAHQASPGYATYSASKGAIIAYTRVIAAQYGSYGIRANCISPGVVHTPMSYVEMPNFDSRIPEFDRAHPLGRIGQPEDIAYAVLFFSSDESSWITGQDLIVDGGWTIGD